MRVIGRHVLLAVPIDHIAIIAQNGLLDDKAITGKGVDASAETGRSFHRTRNRISSCDEVHYMLQW